MISPLLSNIYLHVLDAVWERHGAPSGHAGALRGRLRGDVRHEARRRAGREARARVIARLGLELHPDKTRRVDLSWGKEGFDFLGCHLRKRMSGPIWEKERKRVYFLQRWPSVRAMKRGAAAREGVDPEGRDATRTCARSSRDLNPVLRGWGNTSAPGTPPRISTSSTPTSGGVCSSSHCAQGPQLAARGGRALDARVLREPWVISLAWDRPIPGVPLLGVALCCRLIDHW